jgi:Fic-DOC domain mobile mystery protein B
MQYHYIVGQTPLDEEEKRGLIPSLITRGELDEWEEENILIAREWILRRQTLSRLDLINEEMLINLHKRMFDNVWRWAGRYRQSDKNIGVRYVEIPQELHVLLDDARYWMEHQTFSIPELATRLHHRLVKIHLFPNGNGRHARLIADALVAKHEESPLTWGGGDLSRPEELRQRYIASLRAADCGDYGALVAFATAY